MVDKNGVLKVHTQSLRKEDTGAHSLSFRELFEQSVKKFDDGSVVDGTIVAVRERDVLIDIGYKSEGIIPKGEFSDQENIQVGRTIPVLLESSENDDGMIVISKKKADRLRFWDSIISDYHEGSVIEGKVFKKVKGGFMVDIGMEAFLPASLVGLRPTRNLDQFLGLQSRFVIVKINHKRKNIVLSRKDFLETELEDNRNKLLSQIQEGCKLKGKVKNITDFGAFIDLGGVDGLLHITDMSWGRVSHPSEMLAIGDEVEVVVIAFDQNTKRVSLGLKQKTQNPWEDADSKYPVNSKIKGKVVNILPYGAFVELEKGIEGLVHISELSWTKKVNHPSDLLAIGDVIETIVLSADKGNRKIALGVKQTEVNPWLLVEEKFEVNSIIEGKVRNITDYGVFVELEPGIDGMIHISDISWLKKVNHPSEFFKKNQRVQAKVLSIDQAARKISLGIKQLEEDPWKNLVEKFSPGQIVRGTISKIANFGLFIDLGNHLEGLVHISEVSDNKAQGLGNHYKIGQSLNIMILKVDVESRKIALTLRGDIPQDNVDQEQPPQSVLPEQTMLPEQPQQPEPQEPQEPQQGEQAQPEQKQPEQAQPEQNIQDQTAPLQETKETKKEEQSSPEQDNPHQSNG